MMIFEVYKKANADCSEQREMRHLLFYKLQKITPQTYTANFRTYTPAVGRTESQSYLVIDGASLYVVCDKEVTVKDVGDC